MKKYFVIIALTVMGFYAHADLYLQSGESIHLGGNTVWCGVQEREPSYFCTIESSFDGSFSGEGKTQLEAEFNAKASCKASSRNNGFFCNEGSLNCQKSE